MIERQHDTYYSCLFLILEKITASSILPGTELPAHNYSY
jgi:hypothetical protein